MKNLVVILILFFIPGFILAQTNTIPITGTVTDATGVPLRYAFVLDKATKNATYTDSLGGFKLSIAQASQILVNCKGFKKDSLNVGGKTHVDIVLNPDPSYNRNAANVDNDVSKLQQAFKTHDSQFQGPQLALGGGTAYTNIKETVGSRFLFDQWVHGYTVKSRGQIIQDPATLFNYDKIKGDLFITQDLNSVLIGDKNVIARFVLFSPKNKKFVFERMMGISDSLYSQVINEGSKYKIYKLINMKFIPANYQTDGIQSTGNQYDEYADIGHYFIMNMTTTVFQPMKLTKKGLVEAFGAEGDKLTAYLAAHKGKIDDDYLKNLGDAMNE